MYYNEEKADKLFKNIADTIDTVEFLCGVVDMQDSFSQPDLATIERCLKHLGLAKESLETLWPEFY
jgi:hypothetical protein